MPPTQVSPREQAEHVLPRAPQALVELPVWQMPLLSQQPEEQFAGEQRDGIPHDCTSAPVTNAANAATTI